jgi:hypothetical protein
LSEHAKLEAVLDTLDRINEQDTERIDVDGVAMPKELAHARRASHWLEQIDPQPSLALIIAIRAHHIERWAVPRTSHPTGRAGYLAWRRAAQDHHAARTQQVLSAFDFGEATQSKVAALLRKRRPKDDDGKRDAQCFEDVLCLVFLEQQLAAFSKKISDGKLESILSKTIPKMSPQAIDLAVQLPLQPAHRACLERLLAARD